MSATAVADLEAAGPATELPPAWMPVPSGVVVSLSQWEHD